MSNRSFILALGLAGLSAIPQAMAHHGWGSYDDSAILTLSGQIEQSRYENPHGELVLQSEGKRWRVILAPPSRMRARGLSPDMLAAGTQAEVAGYPSKQHPDEMRAERITIGGKQVELR